MLHCTYDSIAQYCTVLYCTAVAGSLAGQHGACCAVQCSAVQWDLEQFAPTASTAACSSWVLTQLHSQFIWPLACRCLVCLQTKLSLNGGADWQSLPPPANFRFAQCNTCQAGTPAEQCRLHLHGPTSWFAPEGVCSAPQLRVCTAVAGCVGRALAGALANCWQDVVDRAPPKVLANCWQGVLAGLRRLWEAAGLEALPCHALPWCASPERPIQTHLPARLPILPPTLSMCTPGTHSLASTCSVDSSGTTSGM